MEQWSLDDGFPDDSVTAIVQTPDLSLWMATAKGLVRHGEGRFLLFTPKDLPALPDSRVVNLHVDRQGRLWASTPEGFAILENGRWSRLDATHGWTGDYARSFAQGATSPLYVASFNGCIFQTNGKRFETIPPPFNTPQQGYFLGVDLDQRLWAAQRGYVGSWDGSRWLPVSFPIPTQDILGLGEARDGGFWLVSSNSILRIRNGMPDQVRRLSQPVSSFWRVTEDRSGNLWLPSIKSGLHRVSPDGTVLQFSRSGQFPFEGSVRCIWEDHQSSLWIGSGQSGLFRFRPQRVRVLGPEDGLPRNPVTSIAPDPASNRVFIGTFGEGVFVFDEQQVTPPPWPAASANSGYVQTLLLDRRNHLWIGYLDGELQRFDGRELQTQSVSKLVGMEITGLMEDSRGQVWVAGRNGLAVGDATGFRPVATNLTLPHTLRILSRTPDGNVLLGAFNRVYQMENGLAQPVRNAVLPSHARIASLLMDPRGRLWIGTMESGLFAVAGDRLISIAEERGLPRGRITALQQDATGNLWIGIGTDIVRASADHLLRIGTDANLLLEFALFGQSDGLRQGELALGFHGASTPDRQGRLWFATMRGAARVDPANLGPATSPPRVLIESVSHVIPPGKLSGGGQPNQPTRVLERGPFDSEVVLPAGSRRVEITYSLLDFIAPDKQRFHVQLSSQGEEWIDMGNRRTIYFDDLPPGRYQLAVRGADGEGQWSPEPVSLSYVLTPYFYQTSTFRLASAALVLLATALIVRRSSRLRWKHERERLEQRNRLAESQLRLVHILENTTDFVAFANPQQRLLFVNRAGRRLTGLGETEDVAAIGWPTLLAPWAEQLVVNVGLAAAARDGSWQAEGALRHRDGREIPVSQVVITHRNDQGQIDFVSTIMRDISAARRAATIHESLRRLAADLAAPVTTEEMGRILARECREVFGHDAFFIVLLDERWTPTFTPYAEDTPPGHSKPVAIHSQIQHLSPQLTVSLQRDSKTLINRAGSADAEWLGTFGVRERHSASLLFATAHWEGRARAVLSVQSYAATRYTPDYLALLQTLADQCGAAVARLGIESALRESEERLRFALEAAGLGHWDWDLHSDSLNCSPEVARLYGLPPPAGPLQLEDLAHTLNPSDRERIRTAVQRVLSGSTEMIEDIHGVTRPDGSVVWIEGRGRLLRNPDGQPIRLSGIVANITERRQEEERRGQLESQLHQAQKLQAIGTLAGGIAHDFNNILTGIVGNADLLQMDLPDGHPGNLSLQEILKASRRAKELVAQILTFSRRHELRRAVLPPWKTVQEALKLLRASIPSTIEIHTQTTDDQATVLADATQLHQVIMNLCTNAAHAMRENGGRLTLRQDIVTPSPSLLHQHAALREGDYVRLTVADTGHGMPAEMLDRIFDPFFTTKAPGEGTGLGLSVVLGIMQNHEGAVIVTSQPGQGTSFDLYFPRIAPDGHTAPHPNDTPPEPGRGEHILIVDDEEAVVTLTHRILTRLGYRVTGFTDPVLALAEFRARPEAFHLVLTDLTMPKLTGLALTRAVLETRPGMPVALASGYGDPALLKAVHEAGITVILRKPFNLGELSHAVARMVQRAPPAT